MSSFRFLSSAVIGGSAFLYKQSKNTNMVSCDADTIEPRKAICLLNSTPGVVMGTVLFEQETPNSNTSIKGKFTGLTPGQEHGFHIHYWGNLSNGCITAGPHYNPFNVHQVVLKTLLDTLEILEMYRLMLMVTEFMSAWTVKLSFLDLSLLSEELAYSTKTETILARVATNCLLPLEMLELESHAVLSAWLTIDTLI